MGSNIRHGETDALENLGRVPEGLLRECAMVTTLSPCFMCSGTCLLYKIPLVRIVIFALSAWPRPPPIWPAHVGFYSDARC